MVTLPAPVQSITSIVIDGETLPAEAYALYDGFRLFRVDGDDWPMCQDWSVPVSGVGAWAVTVAAGTPVPTLGQLAVGQLGCEVLKACNGDDCRLPSGLQTITRNGITKTFFDPTKLIEGEATGFGLVDQFVRASNPSGIAMPPAIWDPEAYGQPSRAGGATGW